MEKTGRSFCILLAEDNEDDYLLARDALKECRPDVELRWVKDGDELMDQLKNFPRASLVLLDLSMPRKSGLQALKEIRSLPALKRLPIVVFTTSQTDKDIFDSYDQGANSFISKPMGFQPFVKVMRSLCDYWFASVTLPKADENTR